MKTPAGLALLCALTTGFSQTLRLPPRAPGAPGGRVLAEQLSPLAVEAREQAAVAQVAAGNVPEFLRQLCPVSLTNSTGDRPRTVTFWATPDYLALGSDADYLLMPLTAPTAQRVADLAGCCLPTARMVDAIHAAARVRLTPMPLPPGPAMTTMGAFAEHNAIINTQRQAVLAWAPLGALVAGHKKDIVVTARLAAATNRVAIYGWHRTNGTPIQPLYLGHTATWADYSHGVRLVHPEVLVDGQPRRLAEVLADPALAGLLGGEGPIASPRYPTNWPVTGTATARPTAGLPPAADTRPLSGFRPAPRFGEQTLDFVTEPGVRVHINAPARLPATSEVLLVLYALPNGNSIEQTIGRLPRPGDDWRFNIQHIGAQTRWLRSRLPNRALVVAYLENDLKSWPAWRQRHGDAGIPALLERVRRPLDGFATRLALTGHSGGGSLVLGYLNAVEAIPDAVERIAFLDSNYAYDTALHAAKLVRWLKAADQHFLCVLAYDDASALLDGRPFVSAAGGTWGRSLAMLEDLEAQFAFSRQAVNGLRQHVALDGRLQFLLKENPGRKVLHTLQVERNGFIHALLAGTPGQSVGYTYLGERAYNGFIAPE